MEKSFESTEVVITDFIGFFIEDAANFFIVAVGISVLVGLLAEMNVRNLTAFAASFIFSTFKMILTAMLILMIFFYNYELRTIIFEFPPTMNIGVLFTGILAIYEFASSVVGLLKSPFVLIHSSQLS